jgi:hypothetical protein
VAIAQSNVGPDGVRFVSPEHLFVMTQAGGGVFIVTQQRLWAYAGVEPAPDVPKITMPDTGTGGARHHGDSSVAAAALAMLGVIVGAAGLRRRRAASG